MDSLLTVVDLEGLEFSESDRMVWLQAMPPGKYVHPVYGDIQFSSARIDNFVRNFQMGVRGAGLDVDYDHKDKETRAAGWIVAAENRGSGQEGGLWIQVEFTPSAYQALQEKEYRYFSPEFKDEWTNPKTQQTFKDVLFGGAITNRPFLRDILPINLSEGDGMEEFLKQLAELLGLQDADEEKLLSEIKALKDKPAPPPAKEDDDKKLAELADSNPLIAQVLKENEENRKELAVLTAAHRLTEVTTRLKESATDKWMLPPAFTDVIKGVLVQMPTKLAEGVLDAVDQLVKTGLVPMTSPGGAASKHESAVTDQPQALFMEKIQQYSEAQKVDFAEAAKALSKSEPELFALYEGEVLNGARMED